MEPWEGNDSSNAMNTGNENIFNSIIEPGSAFENSSLMSGVNVSKMKGLKIPKCKQSHEAYW